MLELRHYRYFIAVAEELHFGRAAERLHIAQPPLSQQIQAMEASLGVRLFERSRRKVEMTEAGRMLLVEARQVVAQAARAEDMARRSAKGEVGRLEIAFTGSAPFNDYMPALIKRYRDAWPQVHLSLREMSTFDQLHAIREGRLDISFARPAAAMTAPGVEMRLVEREALVVICNQDHPLAAQDSLCMADLSEERFLLHPRHIGTGLYEKVMGLALAAGFTPRTEIEAHQMSTIVGLAAIGLGVAVVPNAMRKFQVQGAAFRPLRDSQAFIDLYVAYRSGTLGPLVRNFVDLMEDKTAESPSHSEVKP